jgi:hypothetical protein
MNRLRSEDTEQMTVINWARWSDNTYPELKMLFHVPNGGSRNKIEAAKFKQMGVRAGVPDLVLPVPKGIYAGLFIEMKYEKGRLQDSQREYLLRAMDYGHCCYVCFSADEAISVLEEYLQLEPIDTGKKENVMKRGNGMILKNGKAVPI